MSTKQYLFGQLHDKELSYNFTRPNGTTEVFEGLGKKKEFSTLLHYSALTLGKTKNVLGYKRMYLVFKASIPVERQVTPLPHSLEEPAALCQPCLRKSGQIHF